ncbi:MAG: hypothetical protein D6727_03765 [Gammaproteobacteria bacterium]|nr:MAG: hypothetical protein D6727_03765 [Gammaproteobacteria bacterium]
MFSGRQYLETSAMKWLRFFTRKQEKPVRDSRVYTVGRAPRRPPRPGPPPVPRNVPEPDPIFGDTGSLAIKDDAEDNANPYDTASWKMDPDKGWRRVDDDKTVTRDRGKKTSGNNPYDTGTFRKGW